MLGYGTGDQHELDVHLKRLKGRAQRIGEPHTISHESTQIEEDRCVRVDLVVILVSDACDANETAIRELLELALHRTETGTNPSNVFGGEKAAFRPTET